MSHWDVCTLLALHARTLHMFEPFGNITSPVAHTLFVSSLRFYSVHSAGIIKKKKVSNVVAQDMIPASMYARHYPADWRRMRQQGTST